MADRKLTFDIEANSDAARRAVADLRREFNKTLAELKRQQGDIALFKAAQQDAAKLERQIKALGKAGGDTTALNATLAAQRAALAQQSAALTAAGVNVNALNQSQAALRVSVERTTRTFNQQKAALTGYNADMREGAAVAASSRAQMLSYAAALVSVGAAVKGINAITTAGTKLQAINASLIFSTGSAEEAAKAYAFVRDEAQRLGLPIEVLAKNFSRFAASTVGTELAGQQTRTMFSQMAQAARVAGLESYQVDRVFFALSQTLSKGRVQSEEIVGQLSESIPSAVQIAARAMKLGTREFLDLVKSGELLSTEFVPKFLAQLAKETSPGLPAAVKTYAAEIERLRNEITLFLQEVGKSGALEAISAQVVIVTQKLREMSDSGELQPAIEQLVETLSLLARGLAELAEFVAKNSQTLLTLASAFAIVKAAQIGLGLGATVAGFIKMEGAARGAAAGIATIGKALKGFVVLAVLGFAVDKLVELVAAIKEANQVEEDMAKARGKRNAEADIAIINNADYANAVVKDADEIEAATERERAAYAKTLKGALAYYEALKQRALRNVGATDAIPQDALDAQRQIRIYRQALTEFDGISDQRIKLEAKQAAEIKRIKEGETETIKLAVEAQVDAVKKARDQLRDAERSLADIARKTASFQQQLAKAGQAKGERSLLDLAGDVGKIRQALAGGDAQGALDQIDSAREGLLELAQSGKEAPLFLQSFARELGQLALQAGEQQRAAAEENVQEQERKLLTLQSLAKQIETLNIQADVSAAEKEMQDLRARTQAFYDANPLVVKVLTQRQDDIALGLEKAPKKASGGLLRGPGTGTSDSILMFGSNGEYMLRAAAVRSLGRARLDYMNRYGRIPGFADGGAIGDAVSRLPAPSASGMGSRRVLNLTLPGVGTFETQADEAVARSLERALRNAALKSGRRL